MQSIDSVVASGKPVFEIPGPVNLVSGASLIASVHVDLPVSRPDSIRVYKLDRDALFQGYIPHSVIPAWARMTYGDIIPVFCLKQVGKRTVEDLWMTAPDWASHARVKQGSISFYL